MQKVAGDPKHIDLPFLTLVHAKDSCPASNAAALKAFKVWLERGGHKLELITLDSDSKVIGNPCDANSPHGFSGLHQQVVDKITDWIKDKKPLAH